MAITIIAQPQDYTPAYNPQWFTATSNQVAQPNFTYTVVCTDLISLATATYQVPARPDFRCVFDAGVFSEQYIRDQNYIPINLYGWQQADGVRKIRVNIGETYGATPTYFAGSNIDFIIWNSKLKWRDFPDYDQDDYIYDSAVAPKYFAGVLDDVTYEDRSSLMYILSNTANDVEEIGIVTRNAAGTILGTSNIANPFFALATYNDRYFCIDIGHKGLSQISAGDVTGTYPIITSSVASYEVFDLSSSLAAPELIKRFTIGCSDRYEVMTVHYLARNGAFNSLNFSLISENTASKQVTMYKQNTGALDAGTGAYGYKPYDTQDRHLSVTVQERLLLRTDWLTDEQVRVYEDCWNSPLCYLDTGHLDTYLSILPATEQYKKLPRYKEKITLLEMEFLFTHQDHRQRC